MEAVIIKNIANSQLRLSSDTGKSKAIIIARDSEYMFKSPFEYGQFVRAVATYEALKKIEVQRIGGKKAEGLYEEKVQTLRQTTDAEDLQLDKPVIEVKAPKKGNEASKEDSLRKEIRQLKIVLKDTKEEAEADKIKTKLKELQSELKKVIKEQAQS